MNIRRLRSSQQLITQHAHAALAARIMRQWQPSPFPDSSRKRSILNAVEHHDIGWAAVDATLVVDETTEQLLDFNELPDTLKRERRGAASIGSETTRTRPPWCRSIACTSIAAIPSNWIGLGSLQA